MNTLYKSLLLVLMISLVIVNTIPVGVTTQKIIEESYGTAKLNTQLSKTLVATTLSSTNLRVPTWKDIIAKAKPPVLNVRKLALKTIDKDGDYIEDKLLYNLTNNITETYLNNKVVIHLLFNVDPAFTDYDKALALANKLNTIISNIQRTVPDITVKAIWTNALVGFALEIPANATILEEIKNIALKYDLNNDGTPDLAVIEAAKQMKALNYYSSIQLGIRPYVWTDLGATGSGITIGVIDTGVDGTGDDQPNGGPHAAFYTPADRIVYFDDLVGDPSGTIRTSPYDDNMHGTHCAGTVLGYYPSKDAQGRFVWTFGVSDLSISSTGNLSFGGPYLVYYVNNTGTIQVDFKWNGSGTIESIFLLFGGRTPWSRRSSSTYIEVARIQTPNQLTNYTLTYDVTSSTQFGFYGVGFEVTATGTMGFVFTIHVPVWEESISGVPYMSGMAWGAHLAAWKALTYYGGGSSTDLASALDDAVTQAPTYNITVTSNSWGGGQDSTIDTAVFNEWRNGVLTVVAAGNSGAGTGTAASGSPAGVSVALTVAALDVTNNITDYSSDGGIDHTNNTVIKPDVAAPGGGDTLLIFSADTHWHDDLINYVQIGTRYQQDIDYFDWFANDSIGISGTSMATPHVAGIAGLVSSLIFKWVGWSYGTSNSWTYPRQVKMIIQMTAYETYPLHREPDNTSYSPTLDKGGKDIHEGYGAVDGYSAVYAGKLYAMAFNNTTNAIRTIYTPGTMVTVKFRDGVLYGGSFADNTWKWPFELYGLNTFPLLIYLPNGTITLPNGTSFAVKYKFKLYINSTNPVNTDFDLYLYNLTGDVYGEPVKLANSTGGFGTNESITYIPSSDGEFVWVVAKRAREDSAGGYANIITAPSVSEYGTPEGGSVADQPGQAWIGWPVKINGTASKDVSRIVIEIWASNGTKLATLDSANGDVKIVDPVYYNYYEANYTIPYDTNLVGQTLTIVTYLYNSTGALTEGPVAQSNIVVNSATAPIPEPTIIPIILVAILLVLYTFWHKRR